VAASAEADFVEEVFVDRLIPARRLPRPPSGGQHLLHPKNDALSKVQSVLTVTRS
jgi:hypothetical protein